MPVRNFGAEAGRGSLPSRVEDLIRVLRRLLSQVSRSLLRISLGVVVIWFGALKFTASSPVGELVARTVPFLPAHWFVPALGGFEVLVGVGLLIGRRLAIVALLMVAHLSGTLLVITAGLVLIGLSRPPRGPGRR